MAIEYVYKSKRWTPEETDYLKKNFKISKYQDIAKHLGKTEVAVRRRIARLRLQKNIVRNHEKYEHVTLRCKDCGQPFTTFEYLTRRKIAAKIRCDECSKANYHKLREIWFKKNKKKVNKLQRKYYQAFGREKDLKRRVWNRKRSKIYRLKNLKECRAYDHKYLNRPGIREKKNARRRWRYWNEPGLRKKEMAKNKRWREKHKSEPKGNE